MDKTRSPAYGVHDKIYNVPAQRVDTSEMGTWHPWKGVFVVPIPASEQTLAKSIAAHESWARTEDRAARTAPARAALEQKFLDEAGGDPARAEHLRKAYFQRLALRSAQARRRKREAEQALAEVAAELDVIGGDVE